MPDHQFEPYCCPRLLHCRMKNLHGKHIVLGCRAAFACYKTTELCRRTGQGASVQVVMTDTRPHAIHHPSPYGALSAARVQLAVGSRKTAGVPIWAAAWAT